MYTAGGIETAESYTHSHMQDKSKLLSYVVASGLTYGAGESIFHFLFKVKVSLLPCITFC